MTAVFEKKIKITSSCGSHDAEVVKSPQVDRISDLPECVMSHILSRLPTKDALRTSVLSRDWKNKWTSIYNIDINDECPYNTERVASFRSYVNKVVDSTHNSRIRSFRLALGGISHYSNHLQELMRKVLCQGVDNLSIEIQRFQPKINLPSCLGRHTSLTQLKLSMNCTMKICNVNCYPKLKSLYLRGSRIENGQSNETGHLSLTFPVLENLQLYLFKFKSTKSVEINVPELVYFRAGRCYSNSLIKIVAPKLIEFGVIDLESYDLCAPVLRYARLSGDASRATAFLKRVPCLTLLDIPGSMAKAILQWKGVNTLTCLERLQELSVGGYTEEAFIIKPNEILDFLQLTPNLQSLTLHDVLDGTFQQPLRWRGVNNLPCLERLQELTVDGSSTEEILVLLQLMPNLQNLTLNDVHHGTLQQPLPPCVVSHLKDLTIFNCSGDSDQISLANLFVEKATNLERVQVYLRKGPVMTDEKIDCWLATLGPESLIKLTIL